VGFMSPWFLTGLFALGVPVFVHLLRRHVTTPTPVSSLMFFEQGTQSSARYRRLKYLLLFALRATFVLLAVLAFANPFVRRTSARSSGHLLLIALDNSFSMRAGTRFADAKQLAIAALSEKPHDELAQIMTLGSQSETVTQPIADIPQLRSALNNVRVGDGHANFGELALAVRSIADITDVPVDLHLFSDMQRTSMPANFADMVLPAGVSLILHPVGTGTQPPNWTVESVDAPAELSDPKDPRRSRVRAVIAGFGTPAATKTASLIINGKPSATRRIDIPANSRATIEFAPLNIGYGFNKCEVRVEGNDVLHADDASFFVVRRSDPRRVLFVHAANELRSPTYFAAALGSALNGSFLMQSTPADQLADIDLSKFAFVVLSDAEVLPSGFERVLTQYVSGGGGVMLTLGTAAERHRTIPLWGASIRGSQNYARTMTHSSIGKVDLTHPTLALGDTDEGNNAWQQVNFFYAAVVEPGNARVIASLADGLPLLLDKQVGEGHVLLFTSGFDNQTNDLPLHPIFVAFVDRAAQYLSNRESLSETKIVNSLVQLRSSVSTSGSAASLEVIDPQGQRPLTLNNASTVQTFRLAQRGFYQIHFATGREAVIGVNPDRRESNLEPLSDDLLKLWNGSSGGKRTPAEDTRVVAAVRNEVPINLWWYVILLALAVVLAEAVIASGHMGTQRESV
jgi:Aerotolerance regulator N-terminal/von Willebrand factor type A domain